MSIRVPTFIFAALLSYALGNINGAILVSKAFYGSDVRESGSKNAGLTNFMRVYGKKSALWVIAIDVGKAVAAALISGYMLRGFVPLKVAQGFGELFVVIGHTFPAAFRFHGGKGILSGVSAAFVIDWRIGLLLLVAFAIIVSITRYVSLGSIVGAALMPLLGQLFYAIPLLTVELALAAGLMIFMHRSNIGRLIRGKENKFSFK